MYINVAVENKSKYTDSMFTYKTNLELKIGDKVRVPFGTHDSEKIGYVFDIPESIDFPEEKIKEVKEKMPDGLNEEIIKTCFWMKKRYAIKYFDAIKCFTISGSSKRKGEYKVPYSDLVLSDDEEIILTNEQRNATEKIGKSIDEEKNEIFLVHGVTSSGKTEVYMKSIEKCLAKGKTAIMLVPEISLTSQTIEKFAKRFGKEKIAVLHSRLTKRERYEEWHRLRSGEAKIAIGARMAVFSPLDDIGVIILDEEHEATYKADMTPKYDTIEVAAKRLKTTNGVLILGSATPSVVSYERAKQGIYTLIELKERYNKTPLPKVDIVDMRNELRNGNMSIISNLLYEKIEESLKLKEQVILLQNRRGYSNFISCRECGNVMKCPECNLSLTYHKKESSMVCHYCGKKFPVPKKCPNCQSKYIKHFGIGTEQVEEVMREMFPSSKIERLDLDAIKNRSELDRILKRFSERKTDILVGTQLVAKGLDFDNVGVVGVIAADTTLNIPDYRSEERTYQLVTQVSGRAGRGDKQGSVVIQSYDPENYAFKAAKNNDYESFFEEEISLRSFMQYPPFGDIIMVNFTSDDEELTISTAERCKSYMENALGEEKNRVLSPKVALNFKGNDAFRQYIIVKCPKGERNRYVFLLDGFNKILMDEKSAVNVNIDVNPYSIF